MEKNKTSNKVKNIFTSDFVVKNFILLKNRWWIFLTVSIISGVVGFFWAMNEPIIYQSNLLFALDEGGNGDNGGGLSGLVAQFGINTGGGGGNDIFSGDNIMNILKSRRMIENVLLSVDTFENTPQTLINYLQKTRKKIKANKLLIDFPVNVKKENLTPIQDSVLFRTYMELNKNYIVVGKPDKFLNLYEVKVMTTNEKLTKVFTDKLITATSNYYTELRTQKSRATLDVLEQRVAAMKGGLNSSITEHAAIQDANLNPAFAEAQALLQKQQVNIQVYGGAYGELFKNLEIARYQYLKDIPLLQVIDPATYPMVRIKTSKTISALIFAISSIAITFFIFWIIRIYKVPAE